VPIWVLMLIHAQLLLMFMDKIKTLQLVFMDKRMKKIWVLVIKDSCLVMLPMSGILKHFIHILMFLLTVFAKRWPFKERMEIFHG
jgi:hypothetical protein